MIVGGRGRFAMPADGGDEELIRDELLSPSGSGLMGHSSSVAILLNASRDTVIVVCGAEIT